MDDDDKWTMLGQEKVGPAQEKNTQDVVLVAEDTDVSTDSSALTFPCYYADKWDAWCAGHATCTVQMCTARPKERHVCDNCRQWSENSGTKFIVKDQRTPVGYMDDKGEVVLDENRRAKKRAAKMAAKLGPQNAEKKQAAEDKQKSQIISDHLAAIQKAKNEQKKYEKMNYAQRYEQKPKQTSATASSSAERPMHVPNEGIGAKTLKKMSPAMREEAERRMAKFKEKREAEKAKEMAAQPVPAIATTTMAAASAAPEPAPPSTEDANVVETGVATPAVAMTTGAPQRTLKDVVLDLETWCNGLTEQMPEILSRDLKTRLYLHASMTRLAGTTFEASCLLAKSIDDDETPSAETPSAEKAAAAAAAKEASAALAATAAKAAALYLAATDATATATEQRERKQLQIEGRDKPSSSTRQHAEGGQSSSSRQKTEAEVQAKEEKKKERLRARIELENVYKEYKEKRKAEKMKNDEKRGEPERRKVDQAAPAHEVVDVRDIAADHEEPVRWQRPRLTQRDGHACELQRRRRP